MFTGGAAKHVVDLSNALYYRGNNVTVASGIGEYISKIDPNIVHFHLPLYSNEKTRMLSGLLSSYLILGKLVKKYSFDIIHTHKRITNALVKCIRLPKSTRHVTHFHNTFNDKKYATVFGDFSIFCSKAVRKNMVNDFGCPNDKSEFIYYGIDQFREYSEKERENVLDNLGITKNKKVISSIGLFAPYKDRKNLVRAVSLIADSRLSHECIFVIQGYGVEENEVRRMIEDRHLNDMIKIVDQDCNTEGIMNISEFMVLNSRDSEGFPFVILEAASIGKMHIGTTVGGIPEFIKDGETGILVPPGNPEALAVAIRSMIDNPQESIRLGKNAKQEYASRFTLDTMVDAIENVYRSVKQH